MYTSTKSQLNLFKLTILIAPQSLTMTDPQPNKAHFDTTQPKT
jgi:hypothetical protein